MHFDLNAEEDRIGVVSCSATVSVESGATLAVLTHQHATALLD